MKNKLKEIILFLAKPENLVLIGFVVIMSIYDYENLQKGQISIQKLELSLLTYAAYQYLYRSGKIAATLIHIQAQIVQLFQYIAILENEIKEVRQDNIKENDKIGSKLESINSKVIKLGNELDSKFESNKREINDLKTKKLKVSYKK